MCSRWFSLLWSGVIVPEPITERAQSLSTFTCVCIYIHLSINCEDYTFIPLSSVPSKPTGFILIFYLSNFQKWNTGLPLSLICLLIDQSLCMEPISHCHSCPFPLKMPFAAHWGSDTPHPGPCLPFAFMAAPPCPSGGLTAQASPSCSRSNTHTSGPTAYTPWTPTLFVPPSRSWTELFQKERRRGNTITFCFLRAFAGAISNISRNEISQKLTDQNNWATQTCCTQTPALSWPQSQFLFPPISTTGSQAG